MQVQLTLGRCAWHNSVDLHAACSGMPPPAFLQIFAQMESRLHPKSQLDFDVSRLGLSGHPARRLSQLIERAGIHRGSLDELSEGMELSPIISEEFD